MGIGHAVQRRTQGFKALAPLLAVKEEGEDGHGSELDAKRVRIIPAIRCGSAQGIKSASGASCCSIPLTDQHTEETP